MSVDLKNLQIEWDGAGFAAGTPLADGRKALIVRDAAGVDRIQLAATDAEWTSIPTLLGIGAPPPGPPVPGAVSFLDPLARTTLNPTLPASIASGDLLLTWACVEGIQSALSCAGNTKLGQGNNTTDNWAGALFWSISDGTSRPTVTWDGSSRNCYAMCARVSNCDGVTAGSVVWDSPYDNVAAVPGATAPEDNSLALAAVMNVNGVAITPSAGWVEIGEVAGNRLEMASKVVPTGAVAASSFSQSGNARSVCALAILSPRV